ncbi:hypothetical protein [Thiohalocapsa sp.]|jgi:putative glutathione S-transferase|nr:hypothetical protein [Thiohalocapsa sp.]
MNMDHITRQHYGVHPTIHTNGIVPKGPTLDFTTPHGREALDNIVGGYAG